MHKKWLTQEECSIIDGAEKIISIFGGFPAMEDAILETIAIHRKNPPQGGRYYCDLFFNVSKIERKRKNRRLFPTKDYVIMHFDGCSDIEINGESLLSSGEIKFSDSYDKCKCHQNGCPEDVRIIKRPFHSFYISSGRNLFITFEEDTCKISAEYVKRFLPF